MGAVKLTKGYFALHADDLSYLVYDIQFYLYSRHRGTTSADDYLQQYPQMIAFANHAISTHGYAPDFVKDWLEKRVAAQHIIKAADGQLVFSDAYQQQLFNAIKEYE